MAKMSEPKILTLHPAGKRGVNIALSRYEPLKKFVLEKLAAEHEITFERLCDLAIEQLAQTFDGNVLWYLVSVKLDLEARGIIERIPKTSPHKLRLV
jgi:hypothetical protein